MQSVKRTEAEHEQEAKPKLREPSLYRVLMHNDDFTPMEFVVAVLEMFFSSGKRYSDKTDV